MSINRLATLAYPTFRSKKIFRNISAKQTEFLGSQFVNIMIVSRTLAIVTLLFITTTCYPTNSQAAPLDTCELYYWIGENVVNS